MITMVMFICASSRTSLFLPLGGSNDYETMLVQTVK